MTTASAFRTSFKRQYVFVGTTATGERVLMSGEVRRQPEARTAQTIDHQEIADPETLSLTSAVFKGKKNISRNHITSGATLAHLGRIAKPAPGYTLAEARELYRIGKRWHLNTMSAACAHMDMKAPEVAGIKDSGKLLDMGITCPETGYKWGTAWLVEPLPADIRARFIELMSKGTEEDADY